MSDYVSADSAPIFTRSDTTTPFATLLWGDPVEPTGGVKDGRTRVRARGWTGWVPSNMLGGEPLLELYFIDVGQGDSVLIVTPDRHHVLVDGGYRRDKQPMGKNGSDFVDWKFAKDYRSDTVDLDAVFISHCDADHYGGLHDLFDPNQYAGGGDPQFDAASVRVGHLYHPGIAWWRPGARHLGRTEGDPAGNDLYVQLLDDRATVEIGLDPATPTADRLQGEYADFWRHAVQLTDRSGNPTDIARLAADAVLPVDVFGAEVSCSVLGPHTRLSANGTSGLLDIGSDSINTNGHSLLMSLRYKGARILLTGDLNADSMRRLLDDLEGRHDELASDVAKGCHHGSHKVSFDFLSKVEAACTIISSGDNEGHGHPRPSAVAAAAVTGHRSVIADQLRTPLVYSTEIARSVRVGLPKKVEITAAAAGGSSPVVVEGAQLGAVAVTYTETKAGDLKPTTAERGINRAALIVGTLYGLVNVRTDGTRILCAVRNEKDHSWEAESFTTRFSP